MSNPDEEEKTDPDKDYFKRGLVVGLFLSIFFSVFIYWLGTLRTGI